MEATIVSFRRGKHTYTPRQFIIMIDGVMAPKDAIKFVNKKVVWTSPQGTSINGIISALHGKRGLLRARFERGLPGQALTQKIKII